MSPSVRRLSLGLAAGTMLLTAVGSASYAQAGADRESRIIFHIDVDGITESSSLAVSTVHPRLVYTTNDSGDGPYVYVLNRAGELVGTTTLRGVTPVDIEAISAGGDGSLVVADIGDNSAQRSSVDVYKIPQPRAGDHTVTPTKLSLTYSDGPRNAESMVYDPTSGRVIVVSKVVLGARIYQTPRQAFAHSSATLTPVADAPMVSTDASLLPGHRAIVIRTYGDAVIYHYPGYTFWRGLDLPTQEMGESIASVPGGTAVWVGSEGVDSPVWSVPLPSLGSRAVAGSGPATGGGSGSGDRSAVGQHASGTQAAVSDTSTDDPSSLRRLGTGAGVLVVVVGAVVLLSRPRRAR